MTALLPAESNNLVVPTLDDLAETFTELDQRVAFIGSVATRLVTGVEWERAAIVAAHVEARERAGRPSTETVKSDSFLTCERFAALGFSGLESHNTVRRYLRAWQSTGLPRPVPGELVTLPDAPFPSINGAYISNNSGNNEWYTPPRILDVARTVMGGIDCDPASSDVAQQTVQAGVHYTADTDGLDQPWHGRVWMNPPYAQPLIGHFVDRLDAQLEAGLTSEATVLVNNATETEWGQRLLARADAVCLIRGRIRFMDGKGTPSGSPLQGQMLVYVGPNVEAFTEAAAPLGRVLVRG